MEIDVRYLSKEYCVVKVKDGENVLDSGTLDKAEADELAMSFLSAAYDLFSDDSDYQLRKNIIAQLMD